MQKFSFIAIMLFASCSNQKARIVEEIKLYKDSGKMVSAAMAKITVDESLKYEELYFTNGKADYSKVGDPKIGRIYKDYQEKNRGAEWNLKVKGAQYQNKIDSLELELKKY